MLQKYLERNIRAIVLLIIFVAVVLAVPIVVGYVQYIERAYVVEFETLGRTNFELHQILFEKDQIIQELERKLQENLLLFHDIESKISESKERLQESQEAGEE